MSRVIAKLGLFGGGLLALQAIVVGADPSASHLNHGLDVEVDTLNDVSTLSWWGVTGETYFIQVAPDLTAGWEYIDYIYPGADDVLAHGFATNTDAFFYRLKYTDQITTDPWNDDFDGDDIGNQDELDQNTDPFGFEDLNGNDIPDDWESFWDDQFAVFPTPIEAELTHGGSATQALYLNNPVAPDTDFTATVSNNLAGAQIVYDYEDSLTGGASYNWTEIDPNDSGRDYDGIRLDNVSSFFDTPQSVSVSFSFPFYGNNYSQIHVSPHGMIALGSQTAAYENTGIPSTAAPDLFIAPFWYDQNQQQAGDVYFYELNDRIIIQYEQVVSTNGDGTYTYQAVLHSSGLIEFFYKEMVGNLESATVGLENSDGTEGLEIAHNEPYVQNGLAVRISQGPAYFVKVFPLNGTTTAGHNTPLNVRFNAFDLTPGTYTADIDIAHTGTGDTPWSVPAILKITNPPSQIELTAPEDGFTMWANESVTLRATATDDDFGVERVEFFADEAKQGESLTGNDYSFNWEPPAPGVYSVTARAVDRLDAVTISEPITVTVLADTDLDRMEDGWEVDNGLDPLDPTDALEDPDGDRIPNLWEYRHQSDPSVAGSVPNPSLTVAIDGSGDHTNLQAAYNAAEDFDIIFAKSGHYEGRLNATSSKRLLWLGELDAATPPVTLENTTSSDTLRLFADTVMDGFAFTCAGSSNERAIYATTVWNQAQSSRIRLINCSIRDHASSSGAVLYNDDADVALIHCTIYRNHSSYSDALLYNRNGTVKTTVRNSIVWNPVQSAPELRAGSYDYEVIDSIVRNGDFDGIDSDPLLTRAGWLTGGSPARGAANATGSAIDIHDEARPTSVNADLGWDQFIDSDTDDLPDWLELQHFGGLTSQDAAADADGDGLSNLQEYELDGDPMDPEGDIDGDGLSDGNEVLLHGTDPLNPDTDSDGMPDGWEVQHELDPTLDDAALDADGDGLSNLWEYQNGFSASEPADASQDTSDNGLPDWWEITHFGTFGDVDATADPDNDGLNNLEEYQLGTDPNNFDTDGDLYPDGYEHDTDGFDPLVPHFEGTEGDIDEDGLSDFYEMIIGTDPTEADTDGDGFTDKEEADVGSYPTVATDYPLE